MERYDLVIIGTGSGNSIVSPDFDDWRIAIVEEGVFGGTCLNRGCIPTKMFVHAADVAQSVRHASHLGIDAHVDAVRWRDIRDRVFGRIDPIAAGGEDYRTNRCPNITVHRGRGRFVGLRQVAIGDTVIEGDRIVVATGARPVIPEIAGLDGVRFHTSDDVMRVDEVPARMVVVGGGFIANELAHVFGAFGSHVTIVNRGPVLLREHDHEIAERFTALAQGRFDVRLGTQVAAARQPGGFGVGPIALDLTDGTSVECDVLLIATGRTPNADVLDPEATGLTVHPDGRLIVDDTQATVVPGIWALGDVSSPYQLKHVANHEMRVVQHNLLHPDAPIRTDHTAVPYAVFTSPQIGVVGMTEREARAAGHDVLVKVQAYGDVAYGWAMEDTTGICKLVADAKTRLLLGAHIMGPHAATVVQQLVQGMRFGQTVDEMARGQYWIHPALPEVVENALLGL